MGFKEVASLDADRTIAIGKKDKQGKPYPKSAEGYYLGKRKVSNKRGESTLHFLRDEDGNLGVWGTTDLNRKLEGVEGTGAKVRITFTGKKATPNGDMYVYKVEVDEDDQIDVSGISTGDAGVSEDTGDDETDGETESEETADEEEAPAPRVAKTTGGGLAADAAARKARVDSILAKGRNR